MRNQTTLTTATFACLMTLATTLVINGGMVWIEDGSSRAPIIIAEAAEPETALAAETLADYVEKASGVRPEIISGAPEPLPHQAVWLGHHDGLQAIFPAVDLNLGEPDEILIHCSNGHLLIIGRDRMVGTKQTEAGTANAIYTFLQNYLGVRWFWPGELGEDVPVSERIAFEPFTYHFNPPFLQRRVFGRPGGELRDWTRHQRILLDSLQISIGHAFDEWWDLYHADHPDYFALQPDGTRSGFPSPGNAKLCESNPAVWNQWLANVEDSRAADLTKRVFNSAANDGSNAGICVCEDCRAWDNPDSQLWNYRWQNTRDEYYAMTDRYMTFSNHLSRMLRDRYPGEELYVSQMAYGPAKPPPVAVELEDNIIVGYVGHFPIAGDAVRQREKEQWQLWAKQAPKLMFRPNIFWYSGGMIGLPTLAVRNTIEDLRFLAENSGIGLAFDTVPRHWATQGPVYYAMAQFAWDPFQDGDALMNDYYRRAFGPAEGPVRRYFDLMEDAHMSILNRPGWRHSMGAQRDLIGVLEEVYTAELLNRAAALLDTAAAATIDADPIFAQRVEFVRTGLEFSKIQMELIALMNRVRESKGTDGDAVVRAFELVNQRTAYFSKYNGVALSSWFRSYKTRSVGRGLTVQDYLGPPATAMLKAAGVQKHYRWGGNSAGRWSDPNNWQVLDGTTWKESAAIPRENDYIILGSHSAEPIQQITIDNAVSVARVVVESADKPLVVSLSGNSQSTLTLTDPIAIEQRPETTTSLHIELDVLLDGDTSQSILLNGASASAVVLHSSLSSKQPLRFDGNSDTQAMFVNRGRIESPRTFFNDGAEVLMDTAETALTGAIVGRGGAILAAQDTVLNGVLMNFDGDLNIRAHGNDNRNVYISIPAASRGGRVFTQPAAHNSSGALIVRLFDIQSSAGNARAPEFHLAHNTYVELVNNQQSPIRGDWSAGIHGTGGLIKSRTHPLRGGAPISRIGDINSYTGGTFIREGGLRLEQVTIPVDGRIGGAEMITFSGQIGPGPLALAADTLFDLNGIEQSVNGLHDDGDGGGTITLNSGTLIVDATTDCHFSGMINGPGLLVKRGPRRMTASRDLDSRHSFDLTISEGILAVAGSVNLTGGTTRIEGGRLVASQVDFTDQSLQLALGPTLPAQPLITAESATLATSSFEVTIDPAVHFPPGAQVVVLETRELHAHADNPLIFGLNSGDPIVIGDRQCTLQVITEADRTRVILQF